MERGFEKAVELLINSGACVDLRHDHGQGILLLVNERDWHVAADLIVSRARTTLDEETSSHQYQELSLLLAAHDGDAQEFRNIIGEQSYDLQSKHKRIGEISLFLAVERQNLGMVKLLLNLAVDVNATDNAGQTALHRATGRRNEELIQFLLHNKASVNCKDDDGRTPWAANVRSRDSRI